MTEFFSRLRLLLGRKRFDDELSEEMAFHRQQAQEQLQADGMSAAEARYAAARQFGNAARIQEESRETVGFSCETAWHDFRYALRQLRKNPGFCFTAVLILALGIGATTAIFSVVNPILFEPLPYPEARRVVDIFERGKDGGQRLPSFVDYVG